ncbi:MAG TPA: vitamin K epoxide reductase family protein [Pirellulaceae bacterium]|nr:vitamin K epoxide reductase family protein [Pirellulaceae bacterium]
MLWSPSPAAYVIDTLIGAFAIGLSVLVPMMPGMAHHMVMLKPGPEVPPGWTYNPSSWHQRAPLIGLAIVGWFISRYLAAVQLGYIDRAWEPLFGEGTQLVLHSDVSRAWPISNAGFGAAAYTFEALMGFMGTKSRWRTMPWMVTFFGILVVPLGATHLILVVLQPVLVGHWCTLCLAAAIVMLVMVPLAVDEVVAMCQFMARAVREGRPFWRTFWVGGTLPKQGEDRRTPRFGSPLAPMITATVWGVSLPWPLVVTMLLGLWLIVAPDFLGTMKPAADSSRLAGALVITIAAVATAEVTRAARFFNVLLALWVAGAPWLVAEESALGTVNALIVGLLLIPMCIPRGIVRERYGGWDRYVV